MSDRSYTSDVLIIGSGPAGCGAAVYCARAGLKTCMSSPSELSGMITRAPHVANYPGLDPMPGRELAARLRAHALSAGAEHVLETISGVALTDPAELVAYGGHQEHHVRALIIATGATGRKAKVPGEEELLGRGVAYCAACDGPFFKDADILVVGDDDQALEEALALAQIGRSVTVALMRREPKLDPGLLEGAQARDNLALRTGLKLEQILGEEAVTGANFRTAEGDAEELAADGVFIYLQGNAPATDFLLGALATDDHGYLVTDEMCQTSLPGVFAAGDVRSKQVRQMIVSAGEGATAALAAERYIRHEGRVRWDRG